MGAELAAALCWAVRLRPWEQGGRWFARALEVLPGALQDRPKGVWAPGVSECK